MSALDETATRDALAAVLAAEHAAVWCHGLASAFLPPSAQQALAAGAEAHRARRDAVAATTEAAGLTPVVAAASYQVPAPVTDAASAARLLAVAEDDTAGAWRGLLERTDDAELRRTGIAALTASAVDGVGWRALGGRTPAVDPFPGTDAG